MATAPALDSSDVSDKELPTSFAEGLTPQAPLDDGPPPQNPARPAPPPGAAVGYDDVVKGLRKTEHERAIRDPDYARRMLDRHLGFAARTERGENPLETGDFELWRFQRATRSRSLSDYGAMAWEGAKSLFNDFYQLGVEGMYLGMKSSLGPDEKREAAEEGRDLVVVAGAKALSANNALVRTVGNLAARGLAARVMPLLSEQQRDVLEETMLRHTFDTLRANFEDDKTAANFHRDVTAAYPRLVGLVGTTEVNQAAANALSNAGPLAVEKLVSFGTARFGLTAVQSGEFAAAQAALAARRESLATVTSLRDALNLKPRTPEVVRELAALEKQIVEASADIATRDAAIAGARETAAAEITGLADAAASRVAAGRSAGTAGEAAEAVGDLAEKIESLPPRLAARIAPESAAAQAAASRSITTETASGAGALVGEESGALLGAAVGSGGPSLLQQAGRDLQRLGELWAVGDTVLPFSSAVRQAEGISGFSKQAASLLLDHAAVAVSRPVLAAGARVARSALAEAATGAALGAVMDLDDPLAGAAAGAGGGALSGATMGALSQWRIYENPTQIRREQAGQRRLYRSLLEMRPDEARVFDSLPEETRTAIATYSAAMPDVRINYIDDPHALPGEYRRDRPGVITINRASPNHLESIVGHELGHYVEARELGATVQRLILGDPDAGVPGAMTLRDEHGAPVRTADGHAFATNAEFGQLRDRYIEQVKASGQARGWSPERIDAAVAQISDQHIASEIHAEQFLQYLGSPDYARDLKGGARGGYFGRELVLNSNFLRGLLGKLGFGFDRTGGIVHSPLLGDYTKSPGVDRLVREYVQTQSRARSGDTAHPGDPVRLDPADLTPDDVDTYLEASSAIARDADGTPLYDAAGRATLRPAADIDRDSAHTTAAVVAQLDHAAAAAPSPDAPRPAGEVQRRETPAGPRYFGQYLSEATLAEIENAGRLNPLQLDQLHRVNAELRDGPGERLITTLVESDPDTSSDGPRPTPTVRSRTDLAWGIEITPDGHLALQTFSPEVLRQNAADLVTRGGAGLWDDDLGRLLADVRQYRENAVTGRPGHTGLTGDAPAKASILQTLTGLRLDDAGDANPPPATATRAPTPAVGPLRLDRINKLFVAELPTAPSTAPAYEPTATNFRPDEPGTRKERAVTAKKHAIAYSTAFEMILDAVDLGRSRDVHFQRANAALDAALNANPEFAAMMGEMIPGIREAVSKSRGRETPEGWTWHHEQATGLMRLVPRDQHRPGSIFQKALHPGGRGGYSIWAIPRGAPRN